MSKKVNHLLTFLICFIVLASSAVPSFALISDKIEDAGEEQVQTEEAQALDNRIRICTKRGLHTSLPENSSDAVTAAPSEYVSVDVKLTKDGVPVLMADETVDRMCVDSSGEKISGRVDSYTLDEITSFYLREGSGGSTKATETKVATLDAVVRTANGKIIIIDVNFSDLDEVLEVVNNDAVMQRVILRIDGKADKIIDKLSGEGKVPNVILKYDGNIIFGVNSTIKKAGESGLSLVQLGTKNHHGVIFYKSVEKKIKKYGLTAVFSMAEPYNARRGDNVTGWDDVISHGFTFIETDYPELLNDYIYSCEKTKDGLKKLIESCSVYEEGNYPKDLKYEFDKAYKNAVETAGRASSNSQLGEALTELSKAAAALDSAQNESTAASVFHFSAGRIITVALCFAAVLGAQIYFYKRRQNEKQ